MHKIEISEVSINGHTVDIVTNGMSPVVKVDFATNEVTSNAYYCEERDVKGFFDAFRSGPKVKLISTYSQYNDWDFDFSVPSDHSTNAIKKIGVGGAVGFVIAGPMGAAAGALLANTKDIPIILKNKSGIIIKGKTSIDLVNEIQKRNFFNKNT